MNTGLKKEDLRVINASPLGLIIIEPAHLYSTTLSLKPPQYLERLFCCQLPLPFLDIFSH